MTEPSMAPARHEGVWLIERGARSVVAIDGECAIYTDEAIESAAEAYSERIGFTIQPAEALDDADWLPWSRAVVARLLAEPELLAGASMALAMTIEVDDAVRPPLVRRIRTIHRAFIVPRPALLPTAARRDAECVLAARHPREPRMVRVADAPPRPATRNPDGSWLVIEALGLDLGDARGRRLVRFLDVLGAEPPTKARALAGVTGAEALARADRIHDVFRSSAHPHWNADSVADRRAVEREADGLHSLGIASDPSRDAARRRHVGRQKRSFSLVAEERLGRRARENALGRAAAAAARELQRGVASGDGGVDAEARARGPDEEVVGASALEAFRAATAQPPALAACARWYLGQAGIEPTASRQEVARDFDVTVEQMRAQTARMRAAAARTLGDTTRRI